VPQSHWQSGAAIIGLGVTGCIRPPNIWGDNILAAPPDPHHSEEIAATGILYCIATFSDEVVCCKYASQESETSQLLSQLLYDAVSQEKLQILALQIALHQVRCFVRFLDVF